MAPGREHIPERSCIACRRKGPKDGFIRLVRLDFRNVIIDMHKRVDGRGAYICPSVACIDKAGKKKALSRSLRVDEGGIPYADLYSIVSTKVSTSGG